MSFRPLSVVLAAGLLDGINPCAFTTLVFLVSFLQHEGLPKRRVLLAGTGYVGAVFVTYFAVLFGLFEAIRFLAGMRWIGVGVSCAAIALALYFAALQLRDVRALRRTGSAAGMSASLPRSWIARIHDAIRWGFRSRWVVLGAAGAGCVVALVESACTGQGAPPTLEYIRRLGGPGDLAKGVAYVLAYDAAFIAPLVGVFLAALAGLSSSRLVDLARAHLATTKLLLALVLLWFAVVLSVLVWKEVATGI